MCVGVRKQDPGPSWSEEMQGQPPPPNHQISTRKEGPVGVGAQDEKRFTWPHLVQGQLEDPPLRRPENSAVVMEPSWLGSCPRSSLFPGSIIH